MVKILSQKKKKIESKFIIIIFRQTQDKSLSQARNNFFFFLSYFDFFLSITRCANREKKTGKFFFTFNVRKLKKKRKEKENRKKEQNKKIGNRDYKSCINRQRIQYISEFWVELKFKFK